MPDLYWCRRVRLTLGDNSGNVGNAMVFGVDLNCSHRIDFNVEKTRDSSKNKGSVTIYNLSVNERNLIDKEYNRIRLNVGYQGDYPLDAETGFWSDLVDGWVHKVTHEQRNQDIITKIEYIEARQANNISRARLTFDGGTSYRSVVAKIVEQSMPNISIEDLSGIPADSVVVRGRSRTFSGRAMREISEIAKNHDARATIDNNRLEIISNDTGKDTLLGVPVFSAETGLIGRASRTEKGVNITTFLYPHIRPNRYFIVRDDLVGTGVINESPVIPRPIHLKVLQA